MRVLLDSTFTSLSVSTGLTGGALAFEVDSLNAAVDTYWAVRTGTL